MDVPDGVNTQLYDVNDRGQIVGSFETVPGDPLTAAARTPVFEFGTGWEMPLS
ncbi:hypothetical protein [Allorhizocola rhizosphaerae]|uniref:hypothetical protein n=1 Tax=Allorhizocola rhizosphaerae TaxID=1872709 RepID=UPI0013C32FBE|nr:hypothetical protein [Allorhizocola rhizosphaerae]